MATTIDDLVSLPRVGPLRVRTRSHFFLLPLPRTRVFAAADPRDKNRRLTVRWRLRAALRSEELHRLHEGLITGLRQHGLLGLKEAAGQKRGLVADALPEPVRPFFKKAV